MKAEEMTEEMIEVEEARLILEGKTRYGSFAFFEKQNLGVSFYLIAWNATACIKILSNVGTAKFTLRHFSSKSFHPQWWEILPEGRRTARLRSRGV